MAPNPWSPGAQADHLFSQQRSISSSDEERSFSTGEPWIYDEKLSEAPTGSRTSAGDLGAQPGGCFRGQAGSLPTAGTQGFPEVQTSNPQSPASCCSMLALCNTQTRPGDRKATSTASRCLCVSGADSKTPRTLGELASSTPVPPQLKFSKG